MDTIDILEHIAKLQHSQNPDDIKCLMGLMYYLQHCQHMTLKQIMDAVDQYEGEQYHDES